MKDRVEKDEGGKTKMNESKILLRAVDNIAIRSDSTFHVSSEVRGTIKA